MIRENLLEIKNGVKQNKKWIATSYFVFQYLAIYYPLRKFG